jgi:hypothetical protein
MQSPCHQGFTGARTGDTFNVSRTISRRLALLASLAKVLIATINEKYTVFFSLGKRHST